ncbi:MAG TPA: hypothetical protein DCX53_10630 [Anaerolineae bacterium]|nr:hypothetical protein [Anaerolineae bacterium]
MSEGKRATLVRTDMTTPFHIDFDWWQKNERDWHVYLRSLLCIEHQEAFATIEEDTPIDWVDPETAEVKPVDGVQNALMSHCVKQPDFLTQQTALVEAVFRLFLTNGNIPMSSEELGNRLNRPANTILRTLGGARVYKGIRPVRG